MSEQHRLTLGLGTHVGMHRGNNEDSIGYAFPEDTALLNSHGLLTVVADGVGSHDAGEQASKQTVNHIIQHYYAGQLPLDAILRRIVTEANTLVFNTANDQATTVVASAIQGNRYWLAHVGDSAAFLARGGQVEKLTTDHTILVPGKRKLRSKLTRAVGHEATVDVDILEGTLQPGDRLILCSDGLTRYVNAQELHTLAGHLSPLDAVVVLADTANLRGGADNISLIVIDVGEHVASADAYQHLVVQSPLVQIQAPEPVVTTPAAPALSSDAQDIPEEPPAASLSNAQWEQIEARIRSQETAPQRRSSVAMLIPLVALVVIISIGAGAFLFGGQDNAGNSSGDDNSNSSVEQINNSQNAPSPTQAPEPTNAPVRGGTITENSQVEVMDTAVTVTVVDGDVASFIIRPSRTYLIVDIYQEGTAVWYRLEDQERNQRGWINQDMLPDYQVWRP